MAPPDHREHWRINKTVDLTVLVTIISGMILMGVYISNQATRQSLLEQAVSYITSDQHRQDEEVKALRYEIKESLNTIDTKLSRVLEKR